MLEIIQVSRGSNARNNTSKQREFIYLDYVQMYTCFRQTPQPRRQYVEM